MMLYCKYYLHECNNTTPCALFKILNCASVWIWHNKIHFTTTKWLYSYFLYYKYYIFDINTVEAWGRGSTPKTPPTATSLQVGTIIHSKCRVGHCNGCIKFEFNDNNIIVYLYMKNNSERRLSVTYITKYILWYFCYSSYLFYYYRNN